MGKKEKEGPRIVGGISFFLSLLFLYVLTFLNLIILPTTISADSFHRWCAFLSGAILGSLIAAALIRGKLSVLIHEMKHAIMANIAGNKWKNMNVESESGHFEYAYTKKTAHMNALISLAPYFFPALFVPLTLIALFAAHSMDRVILLVSGVGYGADLLMNMREISPRQTDLSDIRGGFKIALLYIIGMNTALFTILAAWISQGSEGLVILLYGLLKIGENLLMFGQPA